jgi:nicotinamidase-related amidase
MKSALLVIDVQRGLFDSEPRPFEADAVIARINSLASRARAQRVPVIFVQHETVAPPLAFDSPGWGLVQTLDVQSGDHFLRKTTPDSFLKTELSELLSKLEVSHLVVCGYASEFCVDTTTRRAAALGFPVTLASDAHTTHDKAHAPAAAIRLHENATLPGIKSFGPAIKAVASAEVEYAADQLQPCRPRPS